jgi:transcriptional regulator with XRE-family HTH domain
LSAGRGRFSAQPLAEDLRALLAERGMSLRGLAVQLGIDHSHLSRATTGENGKTIRGDLARRIAVALDLPADYFPEYREELVVARVRSDDALRDRLYRQLTKPR